MNNVHLNLSFKQITELVKQLSPSEKLKLNDIIWNENTDIPIEHKAIVLKRMKKTEKHQLLNWDEASKLLKS